MNKTNLTQFNIDIEGVTGLSVQSGQLEIARDGVNGFFNYNSGSNLISVKDTNGNAHSFTGLNLSSTNIADLSPTSPPIGSADFSFTAVLGMQKAASEVLYDNTMDLGSLVHILNQYAPGIEDVDIVWNPIGNGTLFFDVS